MTLQPQAGIPTGTPDIMFMKEGFWGAIEVKASKTAKFQPLQKERIAKFDEWSYGRVCYPANWDEIRTELEHLI